MYTDLVCNCLCNWQVYFSVWRQDKEAPRRGYQNAQYSEQTTCSTKLEQGKAHLDPKMTTISIHMSPWSISSTNFTANRFGSLSCTPGVQATWIQQIEVASGLKARWWIPSMDPSTRQENQWEEEPRMGANLISLVTWYIISCSSEDPHISDI